MAEQAGRSGSSPRRTSSLPPNQRWALVVFGVVLTGLGLVAVFFTDNEAGSAVAIFAGAVAAIIGLQGTAVRELAMGENKVVFDRRDDLAEAVTEQAEVAPAQARSLVEGFTLADPDARRDPVVSQAVQLIDRADEFVRAVATHLRYAAGPDAVVRSSAGGNDYAITDAHGVVAVQPVYSGNGTLDANQIVKAVERGESRGGQAVLLITNARSLTALARREVDKGGDLVRLLQWESTLGPQPIADAVDVLRRSLGAAGS